MFCSSCGNSLNPGAMFCSKCGQQIGKQLEANIPKPEININANYQASLDCFGGSMFSPNYVYMYIYVDRIDIYEIASKKMERLIYDYIKEEGKNHKIKLFERNGYRKYYIENFKNNLLSINANERAAKGISKEILNFSELNKVKFQFNSSDMVYGEDESYENKTKGYISFKTSKGKYKFTHGYSYNKEMYMLLQNSFGTVIKIHK